MKCQKCGSTDLKWISFMNDNYNGEWWCEKGHITPHPFEFKGGIVRPR